MIHPVLCPLDTEKGGVVFMSNAGFSAPQILNPKEADVFACQLGIEALLWRVSCRHFSQATVKNNTITVTSENQEAVGKAAETLRRLGNGSIHVRIENGAGHWERCFESNESIEQQVRNYVGAAFRTQGVRSVQVATSVDSLPSLAEAINQFSTELPRSTIAGGAYPAVTMAPCQRAAGV